MTYTAKTYIARIHPEQPEPQSMALAGQVIRDGGLVAFPTETVYGLGANALNETAVGRIFAAKERPATDPVIVHIWQRPDIEQVVAHWPDLAEKLAMAFWPGPLTMILTRHPDVPDTVTAGQETVAVRLPAHPVAQALIREAGVPIAAPSANRFSRPSPTNAAHVLADLDGRVDVVLNAGRTAIGVESTILDLTAPTPVVLRPGGVSLEDLREHLPGLAFRPPYVVEGTTAPAPGTLEKHYSPNARVMVFKGDRALEAMRDTVDQYIMDGQRVGIMLRDQDAAYFGGLAAQIVLMGSNDEEMALQLFAGLRTLDASEVDVILVQAPTREGIGLALYDRLLRAAEGQIIEVGQA